MRAGTKKDRHITGVPAEAQPVALPTNCPSGGEMPLGNHWSGGAPAVADKELRYLGTG